MSAAWYFTVVDDVVHLQARFESEDGDMVGDAYHELRPGGSFYGVSFAVLQEHGAGVVTVTAAGEAKIN